MKSAKENSTLALRFFEPDPAVAYPIMVAEHLAQVPRRTILIYCRHGLVSPVVDDEWGGYYFNQEAIQKLRRIEYLRATCGINLTGIKLILHLTDEVKHLRAAATDFAIETQPAKSLEYQAYVELR